MIRGTSPKVSVLAYLGGIALVVGILFTTLLVLYVVSRSYDLQTHGLRSLLATFAISAGLALLGLALLLQAKRVETAEVRAEDEEFLRHTLPITLLERLEREKESS